MAQVAMRYQDNLVLTECCSCGMAFAVPSNWDAARRQSGANFYCPNGHSLSYGTSEADKLRTELERERKKLEIARRERDAAELSRRAQAGENTKLRKRLSGGACPCCNRSFVNLGRHMATKHPEFANAD